MNEKNKNLLVRIVSALVLLPVVLWLLFKGGLFTSALVGVASAIVASELYGIAGLPLGHPAAILGMVSSAAFSFLMPGLPDTWPPVIVLLALAPTLSLLLVTLAPPKGDLRAAASLGAFAALGPPYAGLCLSAVTAMRALPQGYYWILVVLAVTWGNDTGAYFVGRLLGRHKLYPEVSPSKTWEGFFGGLAASVAACFIIRAFGFELLRPTDCVVLGLVSGLLGPGGDLAESMLKRAFGVKDSGSILPGHGGLFDRLDALLFTAPWVFAYAWVLSR